MSALPRAVEDVLNAALVGEFTVIAPSGRPVTHPMIPLYDGEKIYVHSSILFSRKVDHVRANPKVALAVTDPIAVPGAEFHRICVQGDAVVYEDDPHAGWERILPLWGAKEPAALAFYAKRVALPLFWERALIEVTPRRVFVWEGGRTDAEPKVYEPAGVA